MKTKPYAVIDWDKVEKLCAIQCTGEEIAGILNIDYDTLNAGCKRENKLGFSDYFKQKSKNGIASLRRRQYAVAMEGNPTMLVWLGKNWLNQTDKSELDIQSDMNLIVEFIDPDS